MLIEKQFHGDLEATSKGEMLTVATNVKGSGVYVAVERVTGSLQGRKGSFALHHTGVMTRGAPELHVTVVPDSGTEELEGIIGTMMIKIEGGKHSYEFDYSLPLAAEAGPQGVKDGCFWEGNPQVPAGGTPAAPPATALLGEHSFWRMERNESK